MGFSILKKWVTSKLYDNDWKYSIFKLKIWDYFAINIRSYDKELTICIRSFDIETIKSCCWKCLFIKMNVYDQTDSFIRYPKTGNIRSPTKSTWSKISVRSLSFTNIWARVRFWVARAVSSSQFEYGYSSKWERSSVSNQIRSYAYDRILSFKIIYFQPRSYHWL